MLSRILLVFSGLTLRQRLLLSAIALFPGLLLVVLLIGSALGASAVGSSVALGLVLMGGVIASAYLVKHHRTARRAASEAEPTEAVTSVSSRQSLALQATETVLLSGNPNAAFLAWIARLQRLPDKSILSHGLSTRSRAARDFFALRGTQWRLDSDSLCFLLGGEGANTAAILNAVGPADPNDLVSLARLLAGDSRYNGATDVVGRLIWLASAQNLPVQEHNRRRIVQEHLLRGDFASARSHLSGLNAGDYPARFLALDLINPFVNPERGLSEDIWLAGLSGVFRRAGLEAPRLAETGSTPFDRLSGGASSSVDNGPLISVIMSCYEPDEGLVTAVRSMIAQSWSNWELLVTDDASPSSPDALLERVAAMDSRIRVLRSTVNGGTYVQRNEAMRVARGEFVTMQDSDDWVHPRRLEIQARHLLDNPGIVANLSQSVRLSENLMFVQPRGVSIRLTESSIFFRKNEARNLIGDFDTVRRAADSEFRMRLETAVGYPIPLVDVEAPLSMVRFNLNSLSGGDLGDGWMHPARIAYRGAQALWRRQRLAEGMPLTLVSDSQSRAFPAHGHLTGTGPATHELDVLYVLDARDRTGLERYAVAAAAELERLAAAGMRVGFRRCEAIVETRPQVESHAALQALINAGTIAEVLPVDSARTACLVVRHVDALAGVSALDRPIEADAVVIIEPESRLPEILRVESFALLVTGASGAVTSVAESRWAEHVSSLCADGVSSATVRE